jgi:hypothetical protein
MRPVADDVRRLKLQHARRVLAKMKTIPREV